MNKRAFISVSDKTNIVEFAKGLIGFGYEIVSTGGTQKTLEENGVKVINVSQITGFPECLDGRVKTLHPKVHAGILAIRSNEEHMKQLKELDINTIDIVVVNLYPFKQTIKKPNVSLEEAIENIDIGGPSMLRAAAKNWQDVTVIVDAEDYGRVLDEIKNKGDVTSNLKFKLSAKVFEHTAAYDALIADYMRKKADISEFPQKLTLTFEKIYDLRYGENPHQRAAFFKDPITTGYSLVDAKQLNGKELSFNNINDTNGALELLREFDKLAVVAVKHANPCGVACAGNIYDAYMKAYESDPVSIYGGIIATNTEIDAKAAAEMAKIFLEIIVAPSYTKEALEILSQKKNLRVLELKGISLEQRNIKTLDLEMDFKKVMGGLLLQDADRELCSGQIQVVTKRGPSEEELKDLMCAWKIVKHVKSNAILVAKDMTTLGIGPGQVSRIWATDAAIERSNKDKIKGAVLASDAYFPFDDCVKEAAAAGVTAIIQPGGSIRDADSIKACDENGIAMIFTGMRHFKH
ncbi:MAG: bifunctional phosphoribosylaminoimidazolecarboxamide formyltransferase/IMP cyclohydrolase [Eubacteriales bacterium]